MIINKDQLQLILKNNNPSINEKIQVIAKYIFDKTKEDITGIKINEPVNQVNFILMEHMYLTAKQFYLHDK